MSIHKQVRLSVYVRLFHLPLRTVRDRIFNLENVYIWGLSVNFLDNHHSVKSTEQHSKQPTWWSSATYTEFHSQPLFI